MWLPHPSSVLLLLLLLPSPTCQCHLVPWRGDRQNSLPGRKGRRGKVNVKKSIEKGRHTHIYSLTELICVAAPRGEVSASSPLLLPTSHAVSSMSFRPAKKDRNKVTFSLARRKADAQSFWLALCCRQSSLNLQCLHFPQGWET